MNDNHVPEQWPPQCGDLWRDSYPRGGRRPRPYELWFTVDGIVFVSSAGYEQNPDYVRHTYGPMTLVHREEAES